MRRGGLLLLTWALAVPGWGGPAVALAQGAPPRVTGIELVSPHRLPEALVRSAIGDLAGRPRARGAVRESLGRLWSLGLFAEAWVEETPEAGGVRLRYHLTRRPHVRAVAWRGDAGLSAAEAAAAAGLGVGEDAGPDRLERARRDVLAWYAREGFLGARVDVETVPDPETNARDVTFVVQAGEQARLGPVRFRGATRVAPRDLAKAFDLEEGDRYREAGVRQGVRGLEEWLRGEGFFEARVELGEPAWDAATNRVPLDLEVAEGPKVRVEFQGRDAVKESVLRDRLPFAPAGVVDEVEVRTAAAQLEAAYREEGYHFATVTGSLEGEGETLVVRFQIVEGPRVTVESVRFAGNRAFPDERLRELMETRPRGLLRRGIFRQEILDQDLLVLLAFYRSQGYPEGKVGPAEVEFSEDRRHARIAIPIEEDPRLAVGRVAVEGASALPPAELLAAIPLKAGDPWHAPRAEEGRRAVERLYGRRGYHAATVAVETARRDGAVDVTFRVREGGQTRVGRILVSGLVLTREHVVRRELPFGPGDPFNPEDLIEAERRLAGLGIFERVEVEPLRPPPTPFADAEIRVREGKPWRLDLGAGFSTDQGVRGFLEVGHDNLFGTGRRASVRETVRRTGDRTDLIYFEPRVLGTLWEGEGNLFRESRAEIGFDLDRFGGVAAVQRDLFPERIPGLRTTLRYRLESVDRSNVNPTLLAAGVVPGSETIASLTPSLVWDRRDDRLDPHRGSLHLLSVEAAGSPLGSDVSFLKSRVETHWFFEWLPPTVFALSARVGLATPLAGTAELPIEDRFFAGGSTTVRGFREKRVGPLDAGGNPIGGNAQVLLSAEWRFPIWRMVGGALFADTGTVVQEVGDLRNPRVKTGVGAGLRVNTPVGPLRLDFGYALNRIPGEQRWQIYFSVGHPF